MVRSVLAAFAVIIASMALFSIPGQTDSLPLPAAMAAPPADDFLMPPQPEPVAQACECTCDCDALEARVAALESAMAVQARTNKPAEQASVTRVVAAATCPSGQCPVQPRTAAATYKPRWQNYDGRSARQHAIEVHGFNAGLSDAQLAAQHDAYHDRFGGDPPTAARQRTVQYSTASSNCPGGVCPTRTATVQSRGGVFGFGILGRRR